VPPLEETDHGMHNVRGVALLFAVFGRPSRQNSHRVSHINRKSKLE